jgi:hypothetical protein
MSQPALFAKNWRPRLRGNNLSSCILLQPFIENDERPSSRDKSDAAWVLSSYSSLLGEVSYAKEAIVESVVAVWRLHRTEEEGPKDTVWVDHLEAWLVRGRSPVSREHC